MSEPSNMKQNLVDRCSNDCATTESCTMQPLESSSGNNPSCSWKTLADIGLHLKQLHNGTLNSKLAHYPYKII